MNTNKLTQKSIEALQNAQSIAVAHANQTLQPEHLLLSLLQQQDSLNRQLLQKMGIDTDAFVSNIETKINQLPKVTGSREADKIYISAECDRTLNVAEQTTAQMKDEYISVEHIMLALIDTASGNVKELFRIYGIDKNKFLSALQ
ncbi:MAG: type VI secretion system ATPase TssH, partial [Oscillospiraceae bacterium]|nr:type VI secretion system ATPase TssH [Oscillospiraceae bacterium]